MAMRTTTEKKVASAATADELSGLSSVPAELTVGGAEGLPKPCVREKARDTVAEVNGGATVEDDALLTVLEGLDDESEVAVLEAVAVVLPAGDLLEIDVGIGWGGGPL